jgi:ABC-2 type transport system permease protein
MNIFTDGGREFGRYPLSIYGDKVLRFFTYIVPLACVQYYPLLYLLGKTENSWYQFLPLAGFVFLVPCYAFWRFGVRHYKSTGS